MLAEKIRSRQNGIVLYGVTPPKQGVDSDKITDIATRLKERLAPWNVDGLVLYDIQDEQARTAEKRPFPFMETMDALRYSEDYLADLQIPKVIYRAVGKYHPTELQNFLDKKSMKDNLTVFVGAASKSQDVTMSMDDAYKLKLETNPESPLGGVTIPERHQKKHDEHLRVFGKIAQGCSFFVSQGVYDVNASKNFLSDYYCYGREHDIPLVPILFTLTPCGSPKTLEFMKWLGISIPKWLENELIHSDDILDQSVNFSEKNWLELQHFAEQKGIPIGCNIESVATNKDEVDASVELLSRIKKSVCS